MKNYINVHQSFNSHINNIITINKFLLVQVLAGVIGQQAQLPGPDHLPVEQPNKSIQMDHGAGRKEDHIGVLTGPQKTCVLSSHKGIHGDVHGLVHAQGSLLIREDFTVSTPPGINSILVTNAFNKPLSHLP